MTPYSRTAVWRGVAALYAAIVVTLSLLSAEQLAVWAPLARDGAIDRGVGEAIVRSAAVAGLLLLVMPTALHARSGRGLRVAPGLRLSRPLALALVVYVACLALVASAGLRTAASGVALEWFPAWLGAAAARLTPGHVMAYAGLGFLLMLGWGRRVDPRLLGALALAAGAALEILQGMVPGRASNGWDLLSNGLGLLVGLTAGRLVVERSRAGTPSPTGRRRRHRRRSREHDLPRGVPPEPAGMPVQRPRRRRSESRRGYGGQRQTPEP